MDIKGTPKEIADLLRKLHGHHPIEAVSPEATPNSHYPCEWRRFEVITADMDQLREMEVMLDEKGLTRMDIALILFTLRIRPEFALKDFRI